MMQTHQETAYAPARISGLLSISEEITGQIKWFNADKGYGFIIRSGEPDVMLCAKHLKRAGYDLEDLKGAFIRCLIGKRDRGLIVLKVLSFERGPLTA